jgi:hypothetical protein
MAKYLKTIASVLTFVLWLLYILDPLHTKLRNSYNTGVFLFLYGLVGLVYFWKRPLFYPSLNLLLVGLIAYYLIVGWLT